MSVSAFLHHECARCALRAAGAAPSTVSACCDAPLVSRYDFEQARKELRAGAAGLRGVWGVGSDADRSYLGPHILASTVKRVDRAVELAVRWYLQGSLPHGDVRLDLDDDAVGIISLSPEVPPAIRRQVAAVAAKARADH